MHLKQALRTVAQRLLPSVYALGDWTVGCTTIGELSDLSPTALPSGSVPLPEGVAFVADPFLAFDADRWYLFFEAMPMSPIRGRIDVATSDDAEHWTWLGTALAGEWHLSYPHVFRHRGEWYLLPECAASGGVRLYRATAFPLQWEPVAILVSGERLVDPTLVWIDEHGYLFVGVHHDRLRLFWSSELERGWQEHPASPVVANDRSRARPAGRILELGGRRYRSAQDCRRRYGEAVSLHEIVDLSPTRYVERPVGGGPFLHATGAGWARLGMHHLDVHAIEGTDRYLVAYDGYGRRRLRVAFRRGSHTSSGPGLPGSAGRW